MTFPPRLVTILVPVQCFLVLLGWAICRKLVRLAETQREIVYWIWPMPGSIWFIVHLSWLVAAASCAWGVVGTLRSDVEGRVATLQEMDAKAGLVLTALVIVGMFWSIFRTLGWVFPPPLHVVASEVG